MANRPVGNAIIVGVALLLSPLGIMAQVIEGRVTDASGQTPLPFAQVQLLDVEGQAVVVRSSDADGRFQLKAEREGAYRVRVDLLGYQRLESPLLELQQGQTVVADFELPVDPIELEGLRVEVEALERIKTDLRMFGVRVDDLGQRFVDQTTINRRATASDFGGVLQWQSIPNVQIVRGDDVSPPSPTICVRQVASRATCALTVLNGSPVSLETAYSVPREALRAIVLLTPVEATLLYGTSGTGGAVLLFTR